MAIGKLFEIEGGKIIPNGHCDILLPLKRIKDNYPKEYKKIYAYLHYMKSMRVADNPFADTPSDEREEKILRYLGLFIDTEATDIQQALECVEDSYYTTFYGVFTGIKAAMDKFGKELKVVNIDFSAKEGNAANIMRFAKDYEQLRSSYKTAYKDFDEEQGNMRRRGGGQGAYDEDDD